MTGSFINHQSGLEIEEDLKRNDGVNVSISASEADILHDWI